MTENEEALAIKSGVTEAERIYTAKLISRTRGQVDERFSLANYVCRQNFLKRWLLRKFLKSWFAGRDLQTNSKWPYTTDSLEGKS